MERNQKARRARILLVDDADIKRELTADILKLHYDVECVSGGQAALTLIEEEMFDLVLLDIEMPEISGYETAIAIRCQENDGVRIAALTSHSEPDYIRRSEEAGLHAHITQPVSPSALLSSVKNLLDAPMFSLQPDPWRREHYKELARRLGVGRVRAHLATLLQQFGSLLSMLRQPAPGCELHRAAHDMASVGGMLGFDDVSGRCRDLMQARGSADEKTIKECLCVALQDAMLRLERYFAARFSPASV